MNGPGRIVIVGAGECAARAAQHLRELDHSGGVMVIGEETLAPYERPPLSKAALVSDAAQAPVTVLDRAQAGELDIELRLGTRVDAIDRDARRLHLDDGGAVAYDALLLATGARARRLPIDGAEDALVLRTHADSLATRDACHPNNRVVIIGAGLIGLEVAASARARGCEVTVLEVASRPLKRGVPADHAELLTKRHLAEGVQILCDVRIDRVEDGGNTPWRIVFGSSNEELEADVLLVAVGAVPNTELAAASGLDTDNGIAVDEHLRTSDERIFAAGDCCAAIHPGFGGIRLRLESWRNAHDQALVAAANLLGGSETNHAVPWFWSDHYDLGLQVAGLPELADTEVVREVSEGVAVVFGLDTTGRLVSASGIAAGTGIAKHVRVGEMMIAANLHPDPADLADPSISLKAILRKEP